MARKRMTFDEMRNEGKDPQPTNGVICPSCGCGHLDRYGGSELPTGTLRRYRQCRNCGKKWLSSQPPEKIVREVESRGDDGPVLKVRTA